MNGDNPEILILVAAITNKQMGVVQQIAPLHRSQQAIAKRPLNPAPRVVDREIKSEFSSWKQQVDTDFADYEFEFDREEDKSSCLKVSSKTNPFAGIRLMSVNW
jgi:hypothetical protein